jgi:hypothetical protein
MTTGSEVASGFVAGLACSRWGAVEGCAAASPGAGGAGGASPGVAAAGGPDAGAVAAGFAGVSRIA